MPEFVSLGWWLTPFWLRLDWLGKRLQSWGRVSQYSQTDLSYSCVIPWCPHVCYGVKLTQPRVFREGSRVIVLPQGHTYRGCSWLVIDAGGPAHCGRYLSMDRRVQEMGQVAKQEPASIQQTAFLHGFCFESLLEFCPDFLSDGRWPGGWVAFGHGIWYIDRMKVGWTVNYLVPSNILVSLVYSLVGKSNILLSLLLSFTRLLLQTSYFVSVSQRVTCEVTVIVYFLHSVAGKRRSTEKI